MVENLGTSHLDGKCPSQVGNVFDRPVAFRVWLVCVYGLLRGGVQYLTTTGRELLPDKTVTV